MEDLVLIKIFTSRLEAELAKSILKAHGIDCLIRADDEGGMMPALSLNLGIRLFVHSKDKERAKELL